MASWLAANCGTILVFLILTAIAASIIINLIRRKKQGKSSCGCNCAHCAMGGACHQK